ncbi:MAG: hypothetical protein ACE5DI_00380 [Candidatus Micrarchaeia archaeon]
MENAVIGVLNLALSLAVLIITLKAKKELNDTTLSLPLAMLGTALLMFSVHEALKINAAVGGAFGHAHSADTMLFESFFAIFLFSGMAWFKTTSGKYDWIKKTGADQARIL